MKKAYSYLPVVILMAALFACKKNKSVASDKLTGSWELYSSQSSMVPVQTFSEGNGNLLVIREDGYAYYSGGQLVKSGTYTVVEDPAAEQSTCLAISSGTFTRRMVFDGDDTKKVYFNITDDRATFLSGCFALDAGVRIVYKRVNFVEPNN